MECFSPRVRISTLPRLPSSTNGIAITVLSALPWAPRVGDTYASRLDTRMLKSRMLSIVSAGRPGPLSVTVMKSSPTVMSISGATSCSSHASSALSTSSLTTTSGHRSESWPVCATSSLCEQKSSSLLVVNVDRSSRGPGASGAMIGVVPSSPGPAPPTGGRPFVL